MKKLGNTDDGDFMVCVSADEYEFIELWFSHSSGYTTIRERLHDEVNKLNRETLKLAETAVSFIDNFGMQWRDAWLMAIYSLGQTRRENDIKRMLLIQHTRNSNPISVTIYRNFHIGERFTNEDARQRLVSLFGRDGETVLGISLDDEIGELTTNRAIAFLGDYFHLKRCKLAQGHNKRINAYEIVSDCPRLNLKAIYVNRLLSSTRKGYSHDPLPTG